MALFFEFQHNCRLLFVLGEFSKLNSIHCLLRHRLTLFAAHLCLDVREQAGFKQIYPKNLNCLIESLHVMTCVIWNLQTVSMRYLLAGLMFVDASTC